VTGRDTKELLGRFREGEEKAFEEILERHERMVLSLAMSITGNREAAEDLAQEVFLRLFRQLPTYRPEAKISTWLYRVTLNLGSNYRRKAARESAVEIDPETLPARETPEGLLLRGETERELQEALAKLPRREREVFLLRGLRRLSVAEVAEILGVREGTVKATYFHAVEKVRERMKEYFGEI
jgi:RNA polymerase sigma-70 factor (ECF subfamily)